MAPTSKTFTDDHIDLSYNGDLLMKSDESGAADLKSRAYLSRHKSVGREIPDS